jgi:hypothetical protein
MVRFRVADRLHRDRMKTKIDGEVSAFRSGDPPPDPAYSAGVPNCQADESAGFEINAAFPPDCDPAGLHRVGHFQVVMPFTPMFVAYVDPGRRFYALVCDDLYKRAVTGECRSLDDGGVYTVTTRAAASAAPLPPWRRVEVLAADTEPAEVVKRFLAGRPAEGLRPVAVERFAADFQEVWRRETEWRASQGG